MVEKKGLGKAIGHAFLWFGIAIVLFPLYIALVATTRQELPLPQCCFL